MERQRQDHHAPELIVLSLLLMGDGMQASRVNGSVCSVLRQVGLLRPEDAIKLPDQTTHRKWRYGINHICRVQIGMALTRMSADKHTHAHRYT